MTAKERLDRIRQIVINEKKVVVSSLSAIFQVTEETIRRDLEKLESEGFLTRTYGGAILNPTAQTEGIQFFNRANENLEEKKKIALKVLPLLSGKTKLAVDSSSTVLELVKLLKSRADLTLLTNSTEILHILIQSEIDVVSTGGEYNKNSLSLQGRLTKQIIKQYHVDMVLMSCKGLDLELGVLDSNEREAEIKKAMLEQAAEVMLLVDSSKFNQKAFVQLIDLNDVDYIVTDAEPDAKWRQYCEENGIKLIF